MSQKVLLVFLNTVFSLTVVSQSFQISDQMVYGGDSYDGIENVVRALDGGYYMFCNSGSGQTGNKTVSNWGGGDYWLIKTDSLFQNEWQISFGSEADELVTKMLIDSNSNLYLCGSSYGGISGNKTVDTYGETDFWIIKTDPLGNEIWQKSYGGTENDTFRDGLIVDNKLFLIGGSNSGESGIKTGFNRGNTDYWLICADTAGNVVWDKTYGGTELDAAYRMSIDNSGDYLYVFGVSTSNISYEKTEDCYGSTDYWILKVSIETGDLIGDVTIGSEGHDICWMGPNILFLEDYLYLLGSSYGDATGLKTENSRGMNDYWLVKLNTNLDFIWDKTIGGNGQDDASSLLANQNKILIAGQSDSDAGFEKTEDNYFNYKDIWFVLIDTSGNILSDKTIGSDMPDMRTNLYKDDSGIIVGSSIFDSYVSGDFDADVYGDYDAWIFRLTGVWTSLSELNNDDKVTIYPNPAHSFVNIKLEDSKISIVNLYKVSGKCILSQESTGPLSIDVSTLVSGVYIIKILHERNIDRKILIVN